MKADMSGNPGGADAVVEEGDSVVTPTSPPSGPHATRLTATGKRRAMSALRIRTTPSTSE